MNNTKNKIIGSMCRAVTVLLLLICTGCFVVVDTNPIYGNGKIRTQSFFGNSFDAVSVNGDWTVDIRYSETFSVTIDADENLFRYLDIYVSDHTLHIGFQRGYVIGRAHCKAFITMPVLTQCTASGSLTGSISSFNMYGRTMSIVISGTGDIIARDISVTNLRVNISGSGTFEAQEGAVRNMTAVISGSGDINTARLIAYNADITISGSGSVAVWVTHCLTADISGSGSIRYKGSPSIIKRISGAGNIAYL